MKRMKQKHFAKVASIVIPIWIYAGVTMTDPLSWGANQYTVILSILFSVWAICTGAICLLTITTVFVGIVNLYCKIWED